MKGQEGGSEGDGDSEQVISHLEVKVNVVHTIQTRAPTDNFKILVTMMLAAGPQPREI